jgi:hypothetical protein
MRKIRVALEVAHQTVCRVACQVAPRSIRSSLLSLVMLTLLSGGGAVGSAQELDGTTTVISIDAPAPGQQLRIGDSVAIGGWAADTALVGGVDMVEVYLDGKREEGGRLIGRATYGKTRTDVALALGSTAFSNVGFDLVWKVAATAGAHTAYVYAHSLNGWNVESVSFIVANSSGVPAPQTSLGSRQGPQTATATGAMVPTGPGTAAQFAGNPVNMGPVSAGGASSATGQAYGTTLPTSMYGENSYAAGTAGYPTTGGYQQVTTYPQTTGYPQATGYTQATNYPQATGTGYATSCPCSAGATYATTSPYGTGATYAAGSPYATGATYATGSPYATGAGYSASNPYAVGATYPPSASYATGPTYATASPYGAGYANSSGYGYPAANSASTGYPSGALGSPYLSQNSYANAASYAPGAPYASAAGYSNVNPYQGYPSYTGR